MVNSEDKRGIVNSSEDKRGIVNSYAVKRGLVDLLEVEVKLYKSGAFIEACYVILKNLNNNNSRMRNWRD